MKCSDRLNKRVRVLGNSFFLVRWGGKQKMRLTIENFSRIYPPNLRRHISRVPITN